MNKITVLSLLLAGALLLGGCSLYGGTPNNLTNVGTVPTSASTVGSDTVNIQNFAFDPASLTVKKGATVTWTNNDSAPHRIKSDTFNSPQLNSGQSFSFTFTTAGSFDYSCSIHPSMTGKIIVE